MVCCFHKDKDLEPEEEKANGNANGAAANGNAKEAKSGDNVKEFTKIDDGRLEHFAFARALRNPQDCIYGGKQEPYAYLDITIHEAKGLPGLNAYDDKSNPYLLVVTSDRVVGKSQIHRDTLEPQFQHRFRIPLYHPNTYLQVAVLSSNVPPVSDDLIGDVTLPLKKMKRETEVTGWFHLEPGEDLEGKYAGRMRLTAKLEKTPMLQEIGAWMTPVPEKLRHLPGFSVDDLNFCIRRLKASLWDQSLVHVVAGWDHITSWENPKHSTVALVIFLLVWLMPTLLVPLTVGPCFAVMLYRKTHPVEIKCIFKGGELANAPISALDGLKSGLGGFQQNTVDGLLNMYSTTTEGVKSGSLLGAVGGIGKGAGDLVDGALVGTGQLASDSLRGLGNASAKMLGKEKIVQTRKATNALDGVMVGGGALLKEVGSGVRNLKDQPMQGFKEKGIVGGVTGMATGVTGLVAGTVAGATAATASVVDGVAATPGAMLSQVGMKTNKDAADSVNGWVYMAAKWLPPSTKTALRLQQRKLHKQVKSLENLLLIITWQDKSKALSLTIALGAILVVWAVHFLGLLHPAAILSSISTMISTMWSKLPADVRENPMVAKVVLRFFGEDYLLEVVESSIGFVAAELVSILVLVGGIAALTHKTTLPDMVSRLLNASLAYTAARPGWDTRVNFSSIDADASSLSAFDPHCNPIVYLLEKTQAGQ
jgi:hypothetical protein